MANPNQSVHLRRMSPAPRSTCQVDRSWHIWGESAPSIPLGEATRQLKFPTLRWTWSNQAMQIRMATWNCSNKEKHWSKVTNHENHQNHIDFLISPVQKTCEHLVPFSSWSMPSTSSKTRLNPPTCLCWKGVRRCCAWHAEDDAGGANNASPAADFCDVSCSCVLQFGPSHQKQ